MQESYLQLNYLNSINYTRSTMQEVLKYIITLVLLPMASAIPIDGIQRQDTFVWGSLSDSWASGVSFDGKNTDYEPLYNWLGLDIPIQDQFRNSFLRRPFN